ncbi:ATP-binding protein [Niallia sp. Sow4_A1]|uniref:ATP-binding protein n=1 Tax=Niallia hominis TaxID=3133173 RepID=A0ABV1EZS9_9BACI|nr:MULTISPECIES: ATP-binding protein [Bacillaceae]MCM3360637.1 ATP-binding protein [Niallia sp. MER TA 168]
MSELISYQKIVIHDHTEKEWKGKINKDLRDWLSEDFMLSVGIGEAINNAIEHGGFPVILDIHYTNRAIDMRIKDHGNGFNVTKKINDIEKYGTEKLMSDIVLEERGRGILMMMQIFQKVQYNEMGNEVFLWRERKENAEAI